jgi:hypothetical protein
VRARRRAHPLRPAAGVLVGDLLRGARGLLTVHPLAFAASGVPYLLLLAALILRLPRAWAFALCLAVTAAHTFGASTWLVTLLDEPFVPSLALLVGASALTVFAGHRCRRAAACPATLSPARGQADAPP